MHLNYKQLVVSLAVGAVLVSSYPAHLNAITTPNYRLTALEAHTPKALAQTITQPSLVAPKATLIIQEPEAIDIWLAKLAFQESGGKSNLKILDVNNKYSYGCLQFQEGTFRNYGMKYGFISKNTPIEPAIYDCDMQKKIAKLMLAENYSNWRAWYTSSKKTSVGLPPIRLAEND